MSSSVMDSWRWSYEVENYNDLKNLLACLAVLKCLKVPILKPAMHWHNDANFSYLH